MSIIVPLLAALVLAVMAAADWATAHQPAPMGGGDHD